MHSKILKTAVIILRWIFLCYAIACPVFIIGLSVVKGIGQGLQFVLLPPVLLFFLILFWWMKSLLAYITVSTGKKEHAFFLLQILWLLFLVVAPMLLFTVFVIWHRFERPNPLEQIAQQCYLLLFSTGSISAILGVIAALYYRHKANKIISR
ncbi:MAG: hypothetical protein V4580_06520 [Bacteroidota bacterium]